MVRYIPEIEALMDKDSSSPEVKQMRDSLHTEVMQITLVHLSRLMIFLFLAHALVMSYAALYLRTPAWFLWRLAIYPGLFVTVLLALYLTLS